MEFLRLLNASVGRVISRRFLRIKQHSSKVSDCDGRVHFKGQHTNHIFYAILNFTIVWLGLCSYGMFRLFYTKIIFLYFLIILPGLKWPGVEFFAWLFPLTFWPWVPYSGRRHNFKNSIKSTMRTIKNQLSGLCDISECFLMQSIDHEVRI